MQNKPNFGKDGNALTSLLLTTNDQRLTTREAQNKPDQTQFQTQADVFFKILPRLSIITRILPGHWPACTIIQPAKDDELLTLLVNLPLNPADKTNWNRLRAQNAQPFLSENAETKNPKKGRYIKGSKDG